MRETIGSPASILDDLKSAFEEKVWDSFHLGSYEFWPHNIPGSDDPILTMRNTSLVDVFSILELRAPGNSATLESTFSMHNYSAALGEDWVRDISFHNYSGDMKAVDVLSNFTNSTRGKWQWVSKAIDEGAAVDKTCATLDGDTGYLYLKGNLMPLEADAQNLGSPSMFWSNAFVGYGVFVACRSTSYRHYDQETGVTTNGVTGTFTTADGKNITVKAGIITGIV